MTGSVYPSLSCEIFSGWRMPSGVRTRVTAFDLRTPPAFFQIRGGLLLCGIAHLDAILTAIAPALLAMRVAEPLCWTTSVRPSIVATPPCTCTWNLSAPAFDLENFARIAASSWASEMAGRVAAAAGFAGAPSLRHRADGLARDEHRLPRQLQLSTL